MEAKMKKRNHKRDRKIKLVKQKVTSYTNTYRVCFLLLIGIVLFGSTNSYPIEAGLIEQESSTIVSGSIPESVNFVIEKSDALPAFPKELPGDYESRKKYVMEYLHLKNEDTKRWEKIIQAESGFDPQSKAPTYWSLCDRAVSVTLWGYQQPANSFIELRDYPNGIWQATCEEFGATTLRTGVSGGLTHIIETTWEESNCGGDISNWVDQLECSFKIRDRQGFQAWSTN